MLLRLLLWVALPQSCYMCRSLSIAAGAAAGHEGIMHTVALWLRIDDASHDVGMFSYGRYSSCGFMCQVTLTTTIATVFSHSRSCRHELHS